MSATLCFAPSVNDSSNHRQLRSIIVSILFYFCLASSLFSLFLTTHCSKSYTVLKDEKKGLSTLKFPRAIVHCVPTWKALLFIPLLRETAVAKVMTILYIFLVHIHRPTSVCHCAFHFPYSRKSI